MISNRLLSRTEHFRKIVLPTADHIQFLLTFSTRFRPICFFRPVCDQKAVEKDNKNCLWSVKGGAVSSRCSVMPNSRVGVEFLTAIDYEDEFHVNLLFDRSIYRPMCTHMG